MQKERLNNFAGNQDDGLVNRKRFIEKIAKSIAISMLLLFCIDAKLTNF